MNILIVDDEPKIAQLLMVALAREKHQAERVSSAEKALELLEKREFDLLISDLKMPGMDGLALLKAVKRDFPELQFIIMTAFGSINTAVEAMQAGAVDYVIKPFSMEEMKLKVARVEEQLRLKRGLQIHQQESDKRYGNLIGKSDAMMEMLELIGKVAPTDATVLITGESGTGKELAAREIHRLSKRNAGLFVPVHCAAITETLFEAELFGYEKGAFTGAVKSKKGLFEIAHRGTLFLDEIGDIPLSIQVKLLRAVQEKKIVHLGGISPLEVEVRIVAATNRNLELMIQQKTFREDLYFRLAVFPIKMPPLREHKEDIPLLVDNFLNKKNLSKKMDVSLMDHLMNYHWPGNVRELENVLERALILSGEAPLEPVHFPLLSPMKTPAIAGNTLNLEEAERTLLIEALRKSGGNKTEAAKILGITRRAIYSKIKKLGINKN
ncbi:sigma-54-dependent Fis family transcriptional regulator [bacterium]|nr:sigma-54-dependent Fis family transcriptional regulator [bacterium]